MLNTPKLIEKLEKKGYPLWKIHDILSNYGVELRPVLNVSDFERIVNSISYQQRLIKAEKYIEKLNDWNG